MQDFDVSIMRSHLKQCINLQQISVFPTNNNLLSSYFQKQQHYQETSKSDKTPNKNDQAKTQNSQMTVSVSQVRNEYQRRCKQKQRQQPDFKTAKTEYCRKRWEIDHANKDPTAEKDCDRNVKAGNRSNSKLKQTENQYDRKRMQIEHANEDPAVQKDYDRNLKTGKRSNSKHRQMENRKRSEKREF